MHNSMISWIICEHYRYISLSPLSSAAIWFVLSKREAIVPKVNQPIADKGGRVQALTLMLLKLNTMIMAKPAARRQRLRASDMAQLCNAHLRSEERRVGKECRS